MEHATFDVKPLREAYSILLFLERMLREVGKKEKHELIAVLAPSLVAETRRLLREAKVLTG